MGMDGNLHTPGGIIIPGAALRWQFSKSGGPGGQHVNTSDSKVELTCDLHLIEAPSFVLERIRTKLGDEYKVVASGERSQYQNRLAALTRLASQLDEASRAPTLRRPTKASWGSSQTRLRQKKESSLKKEGRRRPVEDS